MTVFQWRRGQAPGRGAGTAPGPLAGAGIPDITPARYDAPRVVWNPVTEVISPEPLSGSHAPGHYQHVLLDTRTGALSFHEGTQHREPADPAWTCTSDVPQETRDRWWPGTIFAYRYQPSPVPARLYWVIDSGVPQLPYLGPAAASALLERVAPHAQELLGSLYDTGTDLDWSAAAVHAGRNIDRLCDREGGPAAGMDVDGDLADYETIIRRYPQVYRPALLSCELRSLARQCQTLADRLGDDGWQEEITAEFGRPAPGGPDLQVFGVRPWYLAVLAAGDPRPARDFTDWAAARGGLDTSRITSLTSDADLARWAAGEESAAAEAGFRLMGALAAAQVHRSRLRDRDWDRLAVTGAAVEKAGRELAALRAARIALITAAISWDDDRGRSDSVIARQAQMSRQSVHGIRTQDPD